MSLTVLTAADFDSVTDHLITPKDQVVLALSVRGYAANARTTQANTKTRGEIRGGGRKPWKQKGTGRARAGSSRSPLWRTGGTVFGPAKERNFTQIMTRRFRLKALLIALKNALAIQGLYQIDLLPSDGKTKSVISALKNQEKSLLVLAKIDSMIRQAVKNVSWINIKAAADINAYDILRADRVIFDQAGLAAIKKRLGVRKEDKIQTEHKKSKASKPKAKKQLYAFIHPKTGRYRKISPLGR